ncbi:ATP-binding protein [Variovorax sp. Varisp41]|uniref:ATP-binding protein n=1 Tax=Variovorax sp. Varisp41 TaxID=3243033 RepID=UPI0039B50248
MVQSQREPVRSLGDVMRREGDRTVQCPEHGEYSARHVVGRIWTPCPVCAAATEAQRAAEEAESRRRADAQLAEEALQRRIAQSGLVGRFLSATFDNFAAVDPAQVRAATMCRDFAENVEGRTGGLWLIGPPGTGKTHLGSAMVNHVIRQKRWAAILSAREIVRMLRATWGNRHSRNNGHDAPQTEAEVIQDLGTCALLVLDEVGVSFGSESETVQLFDVLDLRYKNQLPTVLLSNLPASELKPVLGDRAYDRLREGAVMVPCNWASHRQSGSRS